MLSVVAVPEAINGNATALGKQRSAVNQIFNYWITVGLKNNELVVKQRCLITLKTNGGNPGVVVDIFHSVSLCVGPMSQLVAITGDGE